MSTLILQGDARRIPLADKSVQCIVTSPPFFGLRDYGTGRWEGGEAACDHVQKAGRNDVSSEALARRAALYGTGQQDGSKVTPQQFSSLCLKCGALRIDKQIGLEQSVALYLAELVTVFRECKRILRDDGVLFCEIGDSFVGGGGYFPNAPSNQNGSEQSTNAGSIKGRAVSFGLAPKNKMLIPHRFAIAMQEDRWICRQDNVYHHVACMPESVSDRTTTAHSYVFQFVKQGRYFYDAEAIREPVNIKDWHLGRNDYNVPTNSAERALRRPNDAFVHASGHLARAPRGAGNMFGRNARSVWAITSGGGFADAHFAVMPPELVKRCILAGTSEKGCCPRCRTAWVRETEKTFVPQKNVRDVAKLAKASNKGLDASNGWGETPRGTNHIATIAWRPGCQCNAGAPVPCVAADIFGGAMTTPLVSDRLGRHGIGIDLSWDYCVMGRDRIGKETPLFATIEPTPAAPDPQASLFS